MKFNRNEHSRFVQWLDRTAEKNPLLWLPCVLLIAFALLGEHIVEYAKIVYSHRNTEKIVKEKMQLERKPFALRAVAMSLVMALSFMFVPNFSEIISFNVFADESSESNFDVYMFIADDIIFDRSDDNDDTNFYSDYAKNTMDYYFNDFRSMSEIWMDCMTPEFENSVKVWETTNLVLSPGDVGKKMVDAREYYVTIILSMMNSSYESDTILNDLYNSNTKNGGKILNQFSKYFQDKTMRDLKTFLNQSSYSKEEKEMMESVQKEWLQDNKWVKNIKAADDIVKILKTANNMQDYVDSFISYCQISNVCAEWKDIINYMYNNCDRNNYALISALESFKNYMESDDMTNAAFNMLVEKGVNDFASWGVSKCVKEVTNLIIKRFPAFSGIKIGTALGKTLSNMLTGTDKIVEEYQMVKAYSELMNLLRGAYKKAERTYINNKTSQNACAFLSYVNIYYTALHVGNDYGKEFADAICNGGIINKIMYSKGQYEEYVKHHKNFANYITWANETVTTYWIHNLYWDRPDLYEIYAPLITKLNRIDPTRVEFEKDSVEWGLEDVEFNGAKYTIYPSEATNKEVIITSSDESVATLDNYGNVKVFKAGTCQITITTFWNEFISDTLNVTVVEGHGADSVAFELIEPIIPDYLTKMNFEYTISNNEVTITRYIGEDSNVIIPDIIENLPVVAIGDSAFRYDSNIISITLGNNITKIEEGAFYGCTLLTNVFLPEKLQIIESFAFDNCKKIYDINIPNSVYDIGSCAFKDCTNLTNVSLPDTLNVISEKTFSGCSSLSNIVFPKKLKEIQAYAFSECTNLNKIIVPFNIEKIGRYSFTGCENATIYYPFSALQGDIGKVTLSIGYELSSNTAKICRISTSQNSLVIPNEIFADVNIKYPVDKIGSNVIYSSKILDISIEDGIELIEDNAFSNNYNVTSISIPDSVKSVGEKAFSNCTDLKNASLSESLTEIKKGTFSSCSSLNDITIPNNVSIIEADAFYNCSLLESVTIPYGVTSIGSSAFSRCTALKSISLPLSLTNISSYAFSGCTALNIIIVPPSVNKIGEFAFSGAKNAVIYYPTDAISGNRYDTFYGALRNTNDNLGYSLSNNEIIVDEVEIENGNTQFIIPNEICGYPVTTIEDYAFEYGKDVAKIIIPSNVSKIGVGAFYPDYMDWTLPLIEFEVSPENKNFKCVDGVLFTIDGEELVAFPANKDVQTYSIPNGTKIISEHAFAGCNNLQHINFPYGLEIIEKYAFSAKNGYHFNLNLKDDLFLPETVKSVGNEAFYDVTSALVYYPSSAECSEPGIAYAINGDEMSLSLQNRPKGDLIVPQIINGYTVTAFENSSGWSKITSIKLPDSLKVVGEKAFYYCDELKHIAIPNGVTEIGMSAFHGCKNLESIELPETLILIDELAFHGCDNINNVIIPSTVQYIKKSAFRSCDGLTNIYIPQNVTSIGEEAFASCSKLNEVYIANGTKSIGKYAFRYCRNLEKIIIPNSVEEIGMYAFQDCNNLTIYGYKNSYAESYANSHKIPFVYLDNIPTDEILDIIESADENATLTVDTSKYGTDLTAEEVSAAKDKNLTLVINGNNSSWKTKAADLPNTSVDFKLISPSGNVDKSQFNDIYKNRSFDVKTVNPSGAELTYNVGAENDGCCANIFKVENGDFTPVSSSLITNGQISFIPSDNSAYCIVISTDSNPIGTEELFETTPVVNTVLDSLSVNGVMINGFSPDKTDYTYSVSYANWLSDSSRIYSISASSNNSANVTINDNDFILNSDNYDTATSKDVTITVSSDSGEQTVYTVKFVVEACPHANRVENISKEPTCIELGEKETACSICGKSFGIENISAFGHDFDNGTTIYEPDCVNMGTVQYQCSRCDESFIRTIPALGHRWGEVTVDTAATCTTDGISSRHCEVCGARSYETLIPALGHSFSAWTKINDTTYERVCAICGMTETKIVTSTDHDHIFNGTVNIIIPATCQAVGSQNVHCSIEGCTEFVTEETAKIAHTPAEAIVVNSTCTTAGNSATYCAICNTKLSETELPATGHSFSNYTDTATCTLSGIRTAVCDNGCGTSDSIPTPAKGHSYGDWHKDDRGHWHECLMCGNMTDIISHSENDGIITIQPTETTDGVKTYSCTECGYVIRTETIKKPVLPIPDHTVHTFGTKWFNDSISHWHECTVCGEHSDTAYHNESHSEVTIQPTATTFGTRTYYCSVCGYAVRTETISPTDNSNPPYPVNPTPSYPTITYPTNSGTQTANEPYIYGENSKVGWDAIISEINFAADSSTVRVNMNGITELPQAVVSCIQNRNINLELNMGSSVWTINGLDVTNPKTVNMRVSERSNKIPDSVMDSLYSELTAKQLRLYHSGNFGFTAKLALNVGKKYNGYYATLYYYNTKTKQLEYNSQSYVSGGIAEFEFVHASYYAIGFSSEPIFDDVSSSAGVVDFGTLVDVDSPVTNGVRIPQAVIPRGFKLSNKKRKYRILKKRRLDDLVFVF